MLRENLREISSSRRDLRNFGLLVGGLLSVTGVVLLVLQKDTFAYVLVPGVVLVIAGLLAPGILRPLQRGWMAASLVLGWVMTNIIMGILFYGVFTPIGVVSRLFGKRFLELRMEKNRETYWRSRQRKPLERAEYERQF